MALEVREPLKRLGDASLEQGFVAGLEKELEATTLKEAAWFNTDANFESAVRSVMEAKRHVLADAERLSLDVPSVDLSGWSLAEAGRKEMEESFMFLGRNNHFYMLCFF